jgi:hypothetical protein
MDSQQGFLLTKYRLEKMWINRASRTDDNGDDETPSSEIVREESAASSMSLGDTHVWRENGDDNV